MRPRAFVFAILALVPLAALAAAEPPAVASAATGVASAATSASLTLNDLVEKAGELDGREVTVSGEAVGDILLRKGYGWVNLNDGTNAIGVRAPLDILAAIKHAGRFGVRGDVVRVTGRFHRVDPESGGELDIRATSIEVIHPGGPAPVPVSPARVALAAVALATAGAAGGLWWRRRSRGLV